MILFISSWHLVALLGVFLGFAALLGVWGVLWAAWTVHEAHEDDEAAKREKRSAAAKQGHVTRKERLRMYDELAAESRARVDEITPDDALRFVQRGEEQ